MTHHKPFGSGLTDVDEVHKSTVFILYDIFIFLYQWLYNILCLMLIFEFPPVFYEGISL